MVLLELVILRRLLVPECAELGRPARVADDPACTECHKDDGDWERVRAERSAEGDTSKRPGSSCEAGAKRGRTSACGCCGRAGGKEELRTHGRQRRRWRRHSRSCHRPYTAFRDCRKPWRLSEARSRRRWSASWAAPSPEQAPIPFAGRTTTSGGDAQGLVPLQTDEREGDLGQSSAPKRALEAGQAPLHPGLPLWLPRNNGDGRAEGEGGNSLDPAGVDHRSLRLGAGLSGKRKRELWRRCCVCALAGDRGGSWRVRVTGRR